jgi:endonuclease/exonuclease/phosphatase family metal-dependent hydrolase
VLALVVIAGVLAAAPTAPAAPRKPAAPPSAPAPGAPSPVLRIATFNLENLFDRYDDPYTADSSDDRGTQPKPARALFAVAKIIKAVNADILALQEVENRGFLEEFRDAYLEGMGYDNIVLIEGNNSYRDGRGIDVALLTRVPVLSATTHQHRDFVVTNSATMRFSRDFLQVRTQPHGFPEVHVFVVHAPSRMGGQQRSEPFRVNEARAGAAVLAEQFAGRTDAWVVVLGDFNDEPQDASLQVYLNNPALPLRAVPAADARGKPYTWIGSATTYPSVSFDNILLSRAAGARVKGKARIWNDAGAADASDHRAVSVDLVAPAP